MTGQMDTMTGQMDTTTGQMDTMTGTDGHHDGTDGHHDGTDGHHDRDRLTPTPGQMDTMTGQMDMVPSTKAPVFVCQSRYKRIKGSKERYLLGQKQSANFLGTLLHQATKRHLNNS